MDWNKLMEDVGKALKCRHCFCSAHDWTLYCCKCVAQETSFYKDPGFAPIVHFDYHGHD